jgi:signal transduction histidine kinase
MPECNMPLTLPHAWMRRWSWAIAMAVAIFITVGGLVVLESGRQRIAHEYETALASREAANALHDLTAGITEIVASERGFLLSGDGGFVAAYRDALTRSRTLGTRITDYYQRAGDRDALDTFASVMSEFGARVEEMELAQRLHHSPGFDASRMIGQPGAGVAGMQRLHGSIGKLLARENLRAQRALDASRADQRISTLCVAALSALNIVLFVLLFRNLGMQIERQSDEQRQLLVAREELDRLVRERTSQLEALAWHLQTVSENEKTQLARELHDELGAILTATRLDVGWVHSKLRTREPALADKLMRALGTLDQGIALKRRIIEDMRPTVLTNFGLVTALRTFSEEAAQRNQWQLRLTLPDVDITLDEDVSIALFRVAQETLTNAAKYAQATQVTISLACEPVRVTLDIADNGVGIAPADLERAQTHGILGMRQRVAARGGTLDIRGVWPRGTGIRVTMPAAMRPARSFEHLAALAAGGAGTPAQPPTPGAVPAGGVGPM